MATDVTVQLRIDWGLKTFSVNTLRRKHLFGRSKLTYEITQREEPDAEHLSILRDDTRDSSCPGC